MMSFVDASASIFAYNRNQNIAFTPLPLPVPQPEYDLDADADVDADHFMNSSHQMLWLPPSTVGAAPPAPAPAAIMNSCDGDTVGSGALMYPVPDTPPMAQSIRCGDPFAAMPASPPPLSVSMMSMSMSMETDSDTVTHRSFSISSSLSTSPVSSPSRSSSPCPSDSVSAPLTIRSLLRSCRSSPSSSVCSSSSSLPPTPSPSLQPASSVVATLPFPPIRFTISTFRWKEVTEFVCDDPVVEIRPYNKSDGKRYLYVRIEEPPTSEPESEPDKVEASFHIRRMNTGENLGFLSHRDKDGSGDHVVLSGNLALLVSESIVRKLDKYGIGRGCPPPPDHKLELVITLSSATHDGKSICCLPFYRIKRRHKRNASIRKRSSNDATKAAKRVRGIEEACSASVWDSAIKLAQMELTPSSGGGVGGGCVCTTSHGADHCSCSRSWPDIATSNSCSSSSSSNIIDVTVSTLDASQEADVDADAAVGAEIYRGFEMHDLCERADASSPLGRPLQYLNAVQCRQADVFLHPMLADASTSVSATTASGSEEGH